MILREKAKCPPRSCEEAQTWVLENLAYSPAHSVSFTFVTFMLARIANEVAPVSSASPQPPSKLGVSQSAGRSDPANADQSHAPAPPVASFISTGTFRRKNRSSSTSTSSPDDTPLNPSAVRRQEIETSLASIFSRVLISASVPVPPKVKDRRIADERKRSIVEPFLKIMGVDDRGPA